MRLILECCHPRDLWPRPGTPGSGPHRISGVPVPVIQGSCGHYSADTVHQIDVCLARLYDNARRSTDPVRAVQLLDDADLLLDERHKLVSSTPAASPQG